MLNSIKSLKGARILEKSEKQTVMGGQFSCPPGWYSTNPCTGEPLSSCMPPWDPTLVCWNP
ncbi:hypothetical protein [Aquimarina litoralis]|uniref:hypothetical protein n=1 Tax=Aquimarina litoralis TaxID=584605 RepID=UPI001C574EDD|nr:hypothetical protein [Aquimarina litoralis]MBW1298528.1 hypothetical protein [Aquimarina litoralis]